jgi:hypothetical protein
MIFSFEPRFGYVVSFGSEMIFSDPAFTLIPDQDPDPLLVK